MGASKVEAARAVAAAAAEGVAATAGVGAKVDAASRDSRVMTMKDRRHPIGAIYRWEDTAPVAGVSAEADPMEVRYAIMLRGEFVPVQAKSGDPNNPVRDLYVKVLPKGTSNITGIIIGNPALDVPPYGLGHQRRELTHFFSAGAQGASPSC